MRTVELVLVVVDILPATQAEMVAERISAGEELLLIEEEHSGREEKSHNTTTLGAHIECSWPRNWRSLSRTPRSICGGGEGRCSSR